ncbi:MAG: sigma-54 dependent transcriptional regulator [Candidatus Aminicenantes bacterium]|nr:sigma-54 dependent transcriptional regulator [Candidatus Aminicenantes bacterium]
MKTGKGTILLVDDDPKVLASLSTLLENFGYRTLKTPNPTEVFSIIDNQPVDLVLLDLVMPSIDGLTVLRKILEKKPSLPVVILSGHGTIAKAVEATKIGAFDFLEKPVEIEKINITIENALTKYRLEKEKQSLLKQAFEKYQMVGVSSAIRDIFSLIEKAATSESNVLISGESGTGKELVARAIHIRSKRAAGPFITVNCAAIPEELIESELFGHEKGAFTGATERKIGQFELANGGTLFLDEITDMSWRLQAKILRALETEEIQRIGGREIIKVDARIIAASNRDLKEAVQKKLFREDLFYRLNVIKINIPPLRERKEDIPALVDHFLKIFCEERKRPPIKITPAAMEILLNYSWPGNVRELRNLIEKIVVLSPIEAISPEMVELALKDTSLDSRPFLNPKITTSLIEARQKVEREVILSKLLAYDWNYEKVAKDLDISRATLFNKLKKYGIKRKPSNLEV